MRRMRLLFAVLSDVLDGGKSCLGAFANSDGDLQRTTGAVSCSKESGKRRLEIVVENKCRPVKARTSLLCQVGGACAAQCDEETVEVFFGAVFVADSLELTFADE